MLIDDVENTNCTNLRGDLLLLNKQRTVPRSRKNILKESKTRQKNVAMAWNGYKKANDMIPQSWIIDGLKMYKIFNKVIKLYRGNHEKLEIEMTAGGKS